MYESLSLFSEPTKVWFEHAFGQPTELSLKHNSDPTRPEPI